jgi:hypothetical protein
VELPAHGGRHVDVARGVSKAAVRENDEVQPGFRFKFVVFCLGLFFLCFLCFR